MTDTSPVDETDMEVSARVAAEAGQLLLALRDDFGPVDDREAADRLRKKADATSHELIAARLADVRPDDCVLSEEGADDLARLSARRVWIVDPLDGTAITAINTIFNSGLIDQRTALEILKRGEVLGDDIDMDEVMAGSEAEELRGIEMQVERTEAMADIGEGTPAAEDE